MEFEIERRAPERTDTGERCLLHARVPSALRYLQGHFPGHPIVPGVAQLVPLVYREARIAWPDLGAPASLRRLKFLEALRPGDELEVELVRDGGKLRFEIRRGETRCSHGVLTF
jgi:3-hydroxymyristoyl/3-hydroxydecanoyl-(acyl carrier protein) dehydratase